MEVVIRKRSQCGFHSRVALVKDMAQCGVTMNEIDMDSKINPYTVGLRWPLGRYFNIRDRRRVYPGLTDAAGLWLDLMDAHLREVWKQVIYRAYMCFSGTRYNYNAQDKMHVTTGKYDASFQAPPMQLP